MYCRRCLIKKGEPVPVKKWLAEDDDYMHRCPNCEGPDVETVTLEQMVFILWAMMGHTPKARLMLKEYTKAYFNNFDEEE